VLCVLRVLCVLMHPDRGHCRWRNAVVLTPAWPQLLQRFEVRESYDHWFARPPLFGAWAIALWALCNAP
jgi:hypothetical protein